MLVPQEKHHIVFLLMGILSTSIIALALHTLKLEQYREDWHGPCSKAWERSSLRGGKRGIKGGGKRRGKRRKKEKGEKEGKEGRKEGRKGRKGRRKEDKGWEGEDKGEKVELAELFVFNLNSKS